MVKTKEEQVDVLVEHIASEIDRRIDVDNVMDAVELLVEEEQRPFTMADVRLAFSDAYECSPETYEHNLKEDLRRMNGKAPHASLSDIEPITPATQAELDEFD